MAFCQVKAVVRIRPEVKRRSNLTWSEWNDDEKPWKNWVSATVRPN